MSGRRVVCAACRHATGSPVLLGLRHWDQFMHAHHRNGEFSGDYVQGFIDNKGIFMDRVEAWRVAMAAHQVIKRVGGDTANGGTLYSENLY